jgi:hypothetical protein
MRLKVSGYLTCIPVFDISGQVADKMALKISFLSEMGANIYNPCIHSRKNGT